MNHQKSFTITHHPLVTQMVSIDDLLRGVKPMWVG